MSLTSPQTIVEWHKPPQGVATKFLLGVREFFIAPVAPATLRAALKSIGLPRIPDTTPEQELAILSRYAAEVEHGLMVQYLYAAYAASAASGTAAAVLKMIAIQEMGHLLTVQNLMIAAGGEPYLGRYDWPSTSHFSPFPFALEPLSIQVLAKYAACEMPDRTIVDPEDRDVLEALLADAAQSAAMTPARIGLLYAKLYWLVRDDDAPVANPADEAWNDFPAAEIAAIVDEEGRQVEAGRHVAALPFGTPGGWQADASHWHGDGYGLIIRKVTSRGEARSALAAVAAQGEGFGSVQDGHFDRFVALYRSLRATAELSRAVPLNPWYDGATTSGDAANCIDEPIAAQLAALGDGLYELILLAILLYHSLPAEAHAANRAQVAGAALDCMKRGIGPLGNALVARARHPGGGADTAAAHLCFMRPATDMPGEYSALRQRLIDAIGEVRARIAQLDVPTTPVAIKSGVRDVQNRALTPLKNLIDSLPQSL